MILSLLLTTALLKLLPPWTMYAQLPGGKPVVVHQYLSLSGTLNSSGLAFVMLKPTVCLRCGKTVPGYGGHTYKFIVEGRYIASVCGPDLMDTIVKLLQERGLCMDIEELKTVVVP